MLIKICHYSLGGGYGIWKKLFFVGAIPAVIIANINAFVIADAPEPPEFVPYEYLRIRTKVKIKTIEE